MQIVSSLSLAMHWHGLLLQLHARSHFGIVEYSCLLLHVHAFVSVKNLVLLLACSICVMECTTFVVSSNL